MTDKTKKILTYTGGGVIAAGAIVLGVGAGAGGESLAMEVVGGVFACIGVVVALIGKFKK